MTKQATEAPVDVVARALSSAFAQMGGPQNGETFDEWAARVDRALALSAMAAMRAVPTEAALADVAHERQRQHEKWGVQRHGWGDWMAILGEEFGEASKAAVEVTFNGASVADLRAELIHVAAVALQIVEHIDEIAARTARQGGQDI